MLSSKPAVTHLVPKRGDRPMITCDVNGVSFDIAFVSLWATAILDLPSLGYTADNFRLDYLPLRCNHPAPPPARPPPLPCLCTRTVQRTSLNPASQ